jgi:YidC/Oxa1 family membrane protein insertase
VWGYNTIPGHDVGVVIIIITILVRLVLSPLMHRQLKSQHAMTGLQPKLDEVREKHKENREEQAKAIMALYKEHGVNPLGSCLPLLVQLPILFGLYQVFVKALRGNLDGLYAFVSNPGSINPNFLGFVNLAERNIPLAILAGALQYVQSRMLIKKGGSSSDPTAQAMQLQTLYVLPALSVFIAWSLPAGLPLYWVVTTLFAIAQQYYIMKKSQAN